MGNASSKKRYKNKEKYDTFACRNSIVKAQHEATSKPTPKPTPKPFIPNPQKNQIHSCKHECFQHTKKEIYDQLLSSLQLWNLQDLIDIIMEYTPVLISRLDSNKYNVLCHIKSFQYVKGIPPCSHWLQDKLMAQGLKIALFGSASTDREKLVAAFVNHSHHINAKEAYGCYNILEKVCEVMVNYHIYGPFTPLPNAPDLLNGHKWMRPANFFLILFDADEDSFNYAVSCYEEIVKTKKRYNDTEYAVIFVGTRPATFLRWKSVGIEKRMISTAVRNGRAYIETPGYGVNVQLLFHLALYEYWAQSSV